jgi:hypothetical protein
MKRFITIATLAAFMLSLISTPQPVRAALPQVTETPTHSPPRAAVEHHRPTNPHLHTPPVPKKSVVHPQTKKVKPGVVHQHSRRITHVSRAFAGTVTGFVHNAKGGAVGGASVRLVSRARRHRAPNRHARHPHATTDTGGTFSIHFVHPGNYRVVASKKGAGSGHHPATVRSGGMHKVDIKLNAPKAKKPKKKGKKK